MTAKLQKKAASVWPKLAALSMALTMLPAAPARAAGFIMVDSAFHGTVMVPRILPGPGPRPGIPGPHPTAPVLKGGVSVGLHMQAQDIKVEITDQVAKTYITQTFVNDTDQNLAGTYLFPLPDDTTFSSFSLHIDGKPVEGKILEANEARQQYEAIVRKMIDPGLLEFADYKTVRARIFPIPARGTKKVELEYTQLLKAENGLLKYRFPLKGDQTAGTVDDTKISVKIAGKQGLRTIWSPSHTVKIERPENLKARISYSQKDELSDKDFLLYYSVSDKDMAANVLTHKLEGEDGYFLLSLAPPLKANSAVGKDIVLAADTSGSMQGDKLEQTKKSLKYVITALSANDRFGIVPFNTDAESFKSELVPATADNKRAAVDYIDDLEARGGTNIGDALHTGASLLKDACDRPAYLVLMTDGEPTVGETSISGLLKAVSLKRDIRLFDFGVGYDVNTRLLNKLSAEHHGAAQYLEPGESLEVALANFYEKIKSPVMSDVEIKYSGIDVKDVYPKSVKDIFAGTQVLLLGRYKGSGQATVSLTGKVGGVAKAYSFPLTYAASEAGNGQLARLWAMRRIGYLTEVAQENGNTREVIDEIIALSKKHGIISQYTSFLVTDPSEDHRLVNNGPVVISMGRPRLQQSFVGHVRRGLAGGAGGAISVPMVTDSRSSEGSFFSPKAAPASISASARQFVVLDKGRADDELRNIAKEEVSGKKAVEKAKTINELKYVTAAAKDISTIKNIEGKTFYLRDGFWVDSSYHGEKTTEIGFGSDKYFELARKNPLMSRYLAVGVKLILVIGGNAYKISPPVSG